MKLEDQVCTLEQAKRLKELGVDVESLYEYVQLESDFIDYELGLPPDLMLKELADDLEAYVELRLSAYTVAELGVMLEKTPSYLDTYSTRGTKTQGKFYCFVIDETNDDLICEKFAETEAQARAEALIWIIENGYIKPLELTL